MCLGVYLTYTSSLLCVPLSASSANCLGILGLGLAWPDRAVARSWREGGREGKREGEREEILSSS